MHVVVLGGGSTGEHFVGALRRLDDSVQITLVERRLRELDVARMTPIDALNELHRLVEAVRSGGENAHESKC